MDLNNDLKIGTWKKIHEQNAQELDKCSVHAYITCAKSEGYIELIKNVVGDPLGKFDVSNILINNHRNHEILCERPRSYYQLSHLQICTIFS